MPVRFRRTYSMCIKQALEDCSSVGHRLSTFKLRIAVTKLDESSTESDTAWRGTNHSWPLKLPRQLLHKDDSMAVWANICVFNALSAHAEPKHLWNRPNTSMKLKGRLYSAPLRSFLLSIWEAQSLRAQGVRRLEVFDYQCFHSISKIRSSDRVNNI